MCGIVGAIAERNITEILVEGLKRLEYRGYDSAGVAVLGSNGLIRDCKRVGKVANVQQGLKEDPIKGVLGIAHTRWATHGKPSEANAHPHFSGDHKIAVVHNGIIENHQQLRASLQAKGYQFESQTDTETVVHLIDDCWKAGGDLFSAVRSAIAQLDGAYALAVIAADEPEKIIVAREGSPLVIGLGYGENFVASDPLALRMIKAGLNAELDGQAGIQELAGDATMLYYMTDEAQEGGKAFLEKRRPRFEDYPKFP